MNRNFLKISVITFFILSFSFVLYADEDNMLAIATKVKGNAVRLTLKGDSAALQTGDKVYKGESIKTGADGRVTLIFTDGEMRIITSNSELKFENSEKKENLAATDKLSQTIAFAANVKNIEAAAQSLTGIKTSMAPPSVSAPKPAMPPSEYDKSNNIEPAMPEIEVPQKEASAMPNKSGIKSNLYDIDLAEQKHEHVQREDMKKTSKTDTARTGGGHLKSKADYWDSSKLFKENVTKYNLGLWYADSESVTLQEILPGFEAGPQAVLCITDSRNSITTAEIKFADTLKIDKVIAQKESACVLIAQTHDFKPIILNFESPNADYEINLVKSGMIFLEKIKNDDPETYLYLKASLFFNNKFYTAALKSIFEFEKLTGSCPMHILNLKALIYSSMGLTEHAKTILKNKFNKERER